MNVFIGAVEPDAQKGQGCALLSLAIATMARMLTPINSDGRTPMKSASVRLTRRTRLLFVVDDDEIGDGIENFDPMPVSLVHAREQAGVFQGYGRMCCQRMKEVAIQIRSGSSQIDQAQNADQFAIAASQPGDGQIFPAKREGDRSTEKRFGGAASVIASV